MYTVELSCKKDSSSLILDKQQKWCTISDYLKEKGSLKIFLDLKKIVPNLNSSEFDKQTWIKIFGSGTLKASVDADSSYNSLYLHERVALEIGPEWDLYYESKINIGKPIAIEDCPAWTESLWQWKRYINRYQTSSPKWLIIDDYTRWEGLGLIMEETPPLLEWLPKSKKLVAKLYQWNAKKSKFIY
jgi:hypothetical protein